MSFFGDGKCTTTGESMKGLFVRWGPSYAILANMAGKSLWPRGIFQSAAGIFPQTMVWDALGFQETRISSFLRQEVDINFVDNLGAKIHIPEVSDLVEGKVYG